MLYLVDASYFIFRAYYSVSTDLVDHDDRPVNALYGFARFLQDLIETTRPRYLGVAFDMSLAGSFRNRLYPAYKANREPAPVELKQQFGRCRALCRHLGVAEFASDDYEADDIIGTLTTRMRAQGLRATIITRDKDLSQLVRGGDCFWDFACAQRYGYDDIAERFGARPERMADYLALTGDGVDNIPGVPGIGPKTAAAIFRHFESLDHLYDDVDAVAALPVRGAAMLPGKLREHRDAAFLARRLTTIACDMPLTCARETLIVRPPDLAAIEAFYDAAKFGPGLKRQAERLAAGR
jgi:5'-3' exonuclease